MEVSGQHQAPWRFTPGKTASVICLTNVVADHREVNYFLPLPGTETCPSSQ
jgi:hypothetical protein